MYSGMFLTIALFALSGLFGILTHVFLCLWVYRDAKNNCSDAALWTVITLFTSLLGLILYYAIGRKQHKTKCPKCFAGVRPDSEYCSVCGTPLSPETIVGYPVFVHTTKKRSITPMIVLFIVFCVLSMVTSGIGSGLTVYSVNSGSLDHFIEEYSAKVEPLDKNWKDNFKTQQNKEQENSRTTWDVSLDKSKTTQASKQITLQSGKPNTLYVDYGIDEGKVTISVKQNDKTDMYEISGSGTDETISLADYADGAITVYVSTTDAKDADVEFSWDK